MSKCEPPSLLLATSLFVSIRLSSVNTVVYARSSRAHRPRCSSDTDCGPCAQRYSRIDAWRVPRAFPRSAFLRGLMNRTARRSRAYYRASYADEEPKSSPHERQSSGVTGMQMGAERFEE